MLERRGPEGRELPARDRRPRAGRDLENGGGGDADNGNRSLGGNAMTTGMMIYLLICGLIGLALVVLALMSLIENWFKQQTKAVVLDACGMFFGLVVVLVAFLAILGVVK